jgi:hypothetical protein
MKKIEKMLILSGVVGAVGCLFAFSLLRQFPETFDFSLDDEEDYEAY